MSAQKSAADIRSILARDGTCDATKMLSRDRWYIDGQIFVTGLDNTLHTLYRGVSYSLSWREKDTSFTWIGEAAELVFESDHIIRTYRTLKKEILRQTYHNARPSYPYLKAEGYALTSHSISRFARTLEKRLTSEEMQAAIALSLRNSIVLEPDLVCVMCGRKKADHLSEYRLDRSLRGIWVVHSDKIALTFLRLDSVQKEGLRSCLGTPEEMFEPSV